MKNMGITKLILKNFSYGEEMMEFVKDRKGHDFRYAIDFKKLLTAIGKVYSEGKKKLIKDRYRKPKFI